MLIFQFSHVNNFVFWADAVHGFDNHTHLNGLLLKYIHFDKSGIRYRVGLNIVQFGRDLMSNVKSGP